MSPIWTVFAFIGGQKGSKCTFLCARENPVIDEAVDFIDIMA